MTWRVPKTSSGKWLKNWISPKEKSGQWSAPKDINSHFSTGVPINWLPIQSELKKNWPLGYEDVAKIAEYFDNIHIQNQSVERSKIQQGTSPPLWQRAHK